jgi:hypothetical protein
MTQGTSDRRHLVAAVLVMLAVLGGRLAWKLVHGRGHANATAPDLERERRRVAAFDPSFDPAKPAGALAGQVKDTDGRPVPGAVVAAVRRPGRDELPTFSRPVDRPPLEL